MSGASFVSFRVLATLVLFTSVLLLPWWLFMPLIFVSLFLFPMYIEGVVIAFIADLLYGVPVAGGLVSFVRYSFAFTTSTAIVFMLAHYVKPYLAWYR